eukprot:2505791-Pyramimonas_sp.AAC.1
MPTLARTTCRTRRRGRRAAWLIRWILASRASSSWTRRKARGAASGGFAPGRSRRTPRTST